MGIDTKKTIIIFTINGINSLLGWNAVLASLDYFQKQFVDYNIYSFLPIPLFMGYLLTGFSYHILSNKFKYITLITIGNSIITIALVFMLLTSLLLDQTIAGYILLLFGAFLNGLGSNASQLTFFAMINYLSQDVVSKFTVGTALSGMFITGIRVIILGIAGAGNQSIYPIIIYFVLAIIFNTFDLILNRVFCTSPVYYEKIDAFLLHHDQ
jgi:equilibrative nucleoside transporter 1/2/3